MAIQLEHLVLGTDDKSLFALHRYFWNHYFDELFLCKKFAKRYNAPKKLDNKFPNNLSTWIEYEEIKKEGKYHEQETQKL